MIILYLGLLSCSNDKRAFELYRQRIYNSSKVLYFFRFYNSFPTSDDYTGFTILDSTDKFSFENIKKMRNGFVLRMDSVNHFQNLLMDYNLNRKSLNDSLGVFNDNYDGINITTTEYDYSRGWGINKIYYFKGLKENNYRIKIFGIFSKWGNQRIDSMLVDKGGIFIYDLNGSIKSICFKKLIFKYKADNTNMQYGLESYTFYPIDSIFVSSLTDYGFFKRIK